jgi:3-keto-5-aminohexanoate cleavage enzyme
LDAIVNFAPTGMLPTRDVTPYVPLSVEEIVEDVHRAWEMGITMVHVHARDRHSETPTCDPDVYGEIIAGIRRFSRELIICVSLSGRNQTDPGKRAAPLWLTGEVKPDMGSLTLSSVNFNQTASISSPETIKALASEMLNRGILPELEAFDVGMINYAKYLERRALLRPPHYFNLLLGNIACAQADLLHAGMMVRDLPPESYWSMGGVGDFQLSVNALAVAAGGGVRVGLEDNLWYDPDRTRLASNLELLRRVHTLIEANERKVMSSAELRTRLKLQPGYGHYGRLVEATCV